MKTVRWCISNRGRRACCKYVYYPRYQWTHGEKSEIRKWV